MKTKASITHRLFSLILLLTCISLSAYAQEGLHIASLFDKYGREKNVTCVELNGSILKSYHMTAYKSLVFEKVTPYKEEILRCLKQDVSTHKVEKTQEVTEKGQLRSAYYRLEPATRKGQRLNRYILFKVGKKDMATLVYIEGQLSEEELMNILYKR